MGVAALQADARRWGWPRGLLVRLLPRLQRLIGLHLYRVGVRPLAPLAQLPALPAGIQLRVVHPDELLHAAGDPDLDMHADFVRAALARGDRIYGAFDGDRLVACAWRSFSAAPLCEGMWAGVAPPCFYGYKAYTAPAWRGRRLHAAVAIFSDADLLARGYAAEVGLVEPLNFASLGTARYLGRRRIGYAGFFAWFGWRFAFRTPAVKKIGVRIFAPH